MRRRRRRRRSRWHQALLCWRTRVVGAATPLVRKQKTIIARALTRAAPGGLEPDEGVGPARRKSGMEKKSVRWAPE